MTRKECLDKAAQCVLQDRQNQYGKPEDCFGMIARMWGAYLGVCVSAHDVAAMMALLKIARFRHNPFHEDNAVDCAGYAACMIETATAWEREQAEEQGPQDGDEVVVLWKRKDKAEGVEELVQEEPEPEFNPRDRVQAKMGDGKWRDAFVSGKEIVSGKLHYTVGIHGFDGYYSFPAEDIRPAPRAEGCEDLVQKDAPATTQELYDRIVDANPSIFKPRTPTGEELAEMAEEDGNACS